MKLKRWWRYSLSFLKLFTLQKLFYFLKSSISFFSHFIYFSFVPLYTNFPASHISHIFTSLFKTSSCFSDWFIHSMTFPMHNYFSYSFINSSPFTILNVQVVNKVFTRNSSLSSFRSIHPLNHILFHSEYFMVNHPLSFLSICTNHSRLL